MQIDFHHAVTYVVARHAGFPDADARIIAYAAQYVDDATKEGILSFDNGGLYGRTATAHRMLDYRNLEQLASARVWLPFHFLPGNAGRPEGAADSLPLIERLICRPDSPVAQEMVRACLDDHARPYRLHRLGITAHVLVDTWAHQGFAGVPHRINELRELRNADGDREPSMVDRVLDYFGGAIQSRIPPTGHGRALSYPDLPYLKWSYVDGLGREVIRDNPTDFTRAADAMCRMFQRALASRPDAEVPGLAPQVRAHIAEQLAGFTEPDPAIRHRLWLESIAAGTFGFSGVYLPYNATGPNSWRYRALGDHDEEEEMTRLRYHPSFLTSDWKRFHDAAKAHRREVIDDILPRFGIVAA